MIREHLMSIIIIQLSNENFKRLKIIYYTLIHVRIF